MQLDSTQLGVIQTDPKLVLKLGLKHPSELRMLIDTYGADMVDVKKKKAGTKFFFEHLNVSHPSSPLHTPLTHKRHACSTHALS
jgi:hypothetical protein